MNDATTTPALPNDAPATSHQDAIEKFIERIIQDAKTRTLVCNLALLVMGFGFLIALSTAPTLLQAHATLATSMHDLQALGDMDVYPEAAAFRASTANVAASMTKFTAIAIAGILIHLAATLGLYRQRRYGIYAVGAAAVLGVVTLVMSQVFTLSAPIVYGTLFYFLWNEREKFA